MELYLSFLVIFWESSLGTNTTADYCYVWLWNMSSYWITEGWFLLFTYLFLLLIEQADCDGLDMQLDYKEWDIVALVPNGYVSSFDYFQVISAFSSLGQAGLYRWLTL
jgi:hypothetical protein